jgi:hypothetical protein
MQVEELKAAVRAKIASMRSELTAEEEFLARLEAHSPEPPREQSPAIQPIEVLPPVRPITAPDQSLRVIPAKEKKAMIVALLDERGVMSPREVRAALLARGIDADAGTQVKRALWELAKRGKITRHAAQGKYGRLVATQNGHVPDREELPV